MESKTGRFNIVVRNHVQLVGFRGVVESIARDFGLKGYVFNDKDGSVKIVCEGVIAAVENFINDLRRLSGSLDVKIEKEEISDNAYLPDEFGRLVVADELSLRLDRGIELLEGIKSDASMLRSIKKDTSLLESIKNDTSLLGPMNQTLGGMERTLGGMNKTLGGMNKTLGGMNKTMGGMDKTLGEMKDLLRRIAEK